MMMPAWRIAYGAVSGVECPVRQMALLFAENSGATGLDAIVRQRRP